MRHRAKERKAPAQPKGVGAAGSKRARATSGDKRAPAKKKGKGAGRTPAAPAPKAPVVAAPKARAGICRSPQGPDQQLKATQLQSTCFFVYPHPANLMPLVLMYRV